MDAARLSRLLRRLGERTSRRAALGTAVTGGALAALNRAAAHQAAPDASPETNATPGNGEEPVFLFVQTALSGRGEVNPNASTPMADGTPVPGGAASILLTLEGHSGQTIYFSDRPDRIVGAVPTEQFLNELGFTPENPPNAALVGEFAAGQGIVVLQLTDPFYDQGNHTLVYGVELLQSYGGEALEPVMREQVVERLPAEFGPAALFIDTGSWCTDLNCPTGEMYTESRFGPAGPFIAKRESGPAGPGDEFGPTGPITG